MSIDLKQKAIEGLLWQKAYEDLGIYPNSISGGPTAYEKRSERMEG